MRSFRTALDRLAGRVAALAPGVPSVLILDDQGRLCDFRGGALHPITPEQQRQLDEGKASATILGGFDPALCLGLKKAPEVALAAEIPAITATAE